MKSFYLRSVFSYAAALGMLSMLGGCGSDDTADLENNPVIQTSTEFDKSYVPSLFYSNISPVPNEAFARNADATFTVMESSWNSFKNEIGISYSGVDLSAYYAQVDGNVSTATTRIDTVITDGTYPADIIEAHLALESIRDVLGEMRAAVNMDYFIDGVTVAHHAMEPVSGAYTTYVDDGNVTAFCAALDTSLPAYTSAWNGVNNGYSQSGIAALYTLSTEKSGKLTGNINAMSATLAKLDGNMTDCETNIADVEVEAAKIKPIFVKAFLAFGDFITPFASDMVSMEAAYVPALYCTSNPPDVNTTCQGLSGAQGYLDAFEALVGTYQSHYPIIPGKLNLPGTIYWNLDFSAVNTAITNAQTIAAGASTTADLADAHLALEDVRTAMYHLRSTFENYNFIADRVTDYHNAMEPIAIVVKPLVDSSEVNQTIKDTISAALPGAMNAMHILQTDVPDLNQTLFGVDQTWIDNQNGSIAAQLTNLELLQSGLNDDNATVIFNAAKQVKPLFVPFFKAFGAF